MRGRRRVGGALGAAVAAGAVVLLALVLAPVRAVADPSAAPLARRTGQPAGIGLVLTAQTPTVAAPEQWNADLQLGSTPSDGSLTIVLHGRVRSRSELATSIDGIGLRGAVKSVTRPIAELPARADGTRRVSISLDPAVPGGIGLRAAGAYPVEITARDAAGAELSTVVTHMLVEPEEADELPPLAVAVVAEVGAPPAYRPDGSTDLAAKDLAGAADLLSALAGSSADATLAVTPETIEALGAAKGDDGAAVLAALRSLRDHPALRLPYVASSPTALVEAGLDGELGAQLDRGSAVLRGILGSEPDPATWRAGPDLTPAAVTALHRAGVRHVVLDADQVEPLRAGSGPLSLAQPFRVGEGEGNDVDALLLDEGLSAHLGTAASPALEASRVLAELAVLWLEQPGIERAAVLPVDTSVRSDVVSRLLAGLERSRIFSAVAVDQAFESAEPLTQPGGAAVHRTLVARPPARISTEVVRSMASARSRLASLQAMVGPDSLRPDPMARHLLLATSSALPRKEQVAHLQAAEEVVGSFAATITAPEEQTITLTARDGNVPLTIRNDSGEPVHVLVRLRSTKLEFPKGDTIPLELTEATTRLDIAVRTRASGAFPLQVEITSPDGALPVRSISYSIRSTAVSGVGVVLSAGAALFLLAWWARHWTRTRRSAKLVGAHHPTVGEPAPE